MCRSPSSIVAKWRVGLLADFHDHADTARPKLQQPLTEMRGGFDSDMLATGHE